MATKRYLPQLSGITHFLALPLTTSTSRPMISAAYRKIMDDPISSNIPKPAFHHPEQLFVYLGNLSLGTTQRINQALTVLDSLDLESMLDRRNRPSLGNQLCASKNMASSHSILEVKMHGLYLASSPSADIENTYRLHANVSNGGGLLPRFCADISESFSGANLTKYRAVQTSNSQHLLRGLTTKVVNTKTLYTTVDNENPYLTEKGIYQKKLACFDATRVLSKYHDMIWTDYFRLEKLCIYELGLFDIVRDEEVISRGYIEIGNVSLPGAPTVQPEPWIEGGRYVKRRKLPPSPLYKHKPPQNGSVS
ncbi:MAG: hypothetical protein HETSPECPRED_008316 [Heterodermia speciosa]|uniref:Uncharacterized protein n=1 Tax=Heterodermia speciosa TaxID=116794 RepID=A0A8H3FU25_9LECA|nr:MAG: hypothetical protein HETSPECPRED_008316 [Heterodermia speciosa]